MSTTTETTVVDRIALAELTVEDGFNPRGEIDAEALADLVSSIKKDGILQPVLGYRNGDRVTLIAGHRRLAAAKKAGLKEIPILIRDDLDPDDAAALAFDENEQRESMVAMARGKALRLQFKKHGSFKKVGEQRSMNPQQVSALVKMCDMPESLQEVAMGNRLFSPALAKVLTAVSAVPGGEPVALRMAAMAMFSTENADLITKNPRAGLDGIERDRKEGVEDTPFVSTSSFLLSSVISDPEKVAELTARCAGIYTELRHDSRSITVRGLESWEAGQQPVASIRLTADSIERLTAMKVPFTIEAPRSQTYQQTFTYIFDREVLESEIELAVEEGEERVKDALRRKEQQKKQAGEQRAESAVAQRGEQGAGKSDHQIAKEEQAAARANNEAIGQRLLARSSRKHTKKQTLEVTRLMALVFVRQSQHIAGVGMRLCFPSWKEVETRELKSGGKREKINYLAPKEAQVRLIESIEKARTVDQINQIVSDAIVAATFSDESELPRSKRLDNSWHREKISNVNRGDRALIDALAVGVLPEEVEARREASVERGYEVLAPQSMYAGNAGDDDPGEEDDFEGDDPEKTLDDA